MAKRKTSKKKGSFLQTLLAIAASLLAAFSVYMAQGEQQPFQVHFIDVGQADCALVISDGKTMLIDGGNPGDGPKIIEYLQGVGVTQLDVLIATHPHADHIGGLPYVIENIPVTRAWLSPYVHTTKLYEELLTALGDRQVYTLIPEMGETFDLGGASCQFISDGAGFDDINDASLMLRAAYGDTSVLFTGDAEIPAEQKALDSGLELRSTVLKVGHHGSETSSGQAFLDAVQPQMAVISVGEGNSYGHPHQKALDRLTCEIYRTDREGTVVLGSDGVTFAPQDGSSILKLYIGSRQSFKFHTLTCEYLPELQNMIPFFTRSTATSMGYEPCGSCKP